MFCVEKIVMESRIRTPPKAVRPKTTGTPGPNICIDVLYLYIYDRGLRVLGLPPPAMGWVPSQIAGFRPVPWDGFLISGGA